MRHLTSLIVAPIIAVGIYVLIGVANVKSATGLGQVDTNRTRGYFNLGVAVACLVIAGLLYSLLVLSRLSPLGTVLAGLALLGVGVWAWFDHQSFLDRMPSGIPGVRGAGHAGAGAITIALSVPLILTLFSPRRWRKYATPRPAGTPAPGAGPAYASSPSYADSPPDASSTAPSYDDTPAYAPPTYGSTLGTAETRGSSTSTDLFGNSRYPSSPVSYDGPETTRQL
jgi:hypothetical protein